MYREKSVGFWCSYGFLFYGGEIFPLFPGY
jgi:hypothetical protein